MKTASFRWNMGMKIYPILSLPDSEGKGGWSNIWAGMPKSSMENNDLLIRQAVSKWSVA